MESTENEPLLRNKSQQDASSIKDGIKDGGQSKGTWRRFIILTIVELLYLQTTGLMGYILSEWIQHTVKTQHFRNQTFAENISSCENQNHSSDDYRMYVRVQQESAHWIMYYNIAQRVTAFISNLIWPTYTDSYGRKFLFLMTTAFLTIRTGLLSFIMYTNTSFMYIIVWFGLEGCFGTSFALINVSFLFVADEFKEKGARVLAVVAVEANILMTNMVSGLISGLFVDNLGFLIPTLVCLGMASASLVVTIVFLPETLKPESKRKPPDVCSVMRRPLEFYTSSAFAGRRTEYCLLILAFAFASLGTQNRTTIETIFLLGMPFCWTPTLIGYFELARHFGQAVFGLGTVKFCQKFISNEWIAINSTLFCIVSYVVTGFATSQIMIYSVTVLSVFSFSMIPMTRGILSTITPQDKQGSMFASIAAIEVITSLGALATQNTVYAVTVSFVNGFVFYIMAFYIFVDFILLVAYVIYTRHKLNQRNSTDIQ